MGRTDVAHPTSSAWRLETDADADGWLSSVFSATVSSNLEHGRQDLTSRMPCDSRHQQAKIHLQAIRRKQLDWMRQRDSLGASDHPRQLPIRSVGGSSNIQSPVQVHMRRRLVLSWGGCFEPKNLRRASSCLFPDSLISLDTRETEITATWKWRALGLFDRAAAGGRLSYHNIA